MAEHGRSERLARQEVEHEQPTVSAGDGGVATVGGEVDVVPTVLEVALVHDPSGLEVDERPARVRVEPES